jgi:L-2-hydroxyglutarate oxidase
MPTFDLAIVGAGIVGLATARAARAADPDARIIVLEKEGSPAGHQTGRNSGVIHAGVYYKPGSEKARLCGAGRRSMVEFCQSHGVAHEICGKTVVAVSKDELPKLAELESRCLTNGVPAERIGPERLRELEPHANGIAALYVPVTGIADYPAVCDALVADHLEAGGELRLGCAVLRGHERPDGLALETTSGDIVASRVVTCAGLHADRVARAVSGPDGAGDLRIVPFRGEYFELAPSKSHLVRALIYPVPDPQFPFLGVHLTRGIHGRVHAGPNAVLALAREGYSWRHRSWTDLRETLQFPGFRRLAAKHWRYGLDEMVRSLSRQRFARALQRLVPEVSVHDLEPSAAGVRAQAVKADGSLVDDFEFRSVGRALHVLNAPSPAATASLEIGRVIVERLGTDWAR